MELLEVKNLGKKYRDFRLEDISFTLPKGYIMGYVGQNGSGKTTTLDLITHVCKTKEGEIRVDGIRYEDDPVRYLESIGYIGEELLFPSDFTLKEIRAVMRSFYRGFDTARFDGLVGRFGLPEKKKVSTFSQGMSVKLMFATMLARQTKLLIMDEATNGLDPVARQEVLGLLQEYVADGEHSILFSTHILHDLEQIADYIYFIDDGRMVMYDAKDELLEGYLIVKGGLELLDDTLRGQLIGIEEHAYGFEAVVPSDLADMLPRGIVYEKPDIDRIVIHFIKNKNRIAVEKGAEGGRI